MSSLAPTGKPGRGDARAPKDGCVAAIKSITKFKKENIQSSRALPFQRPQWFVVQRNRWCKNVGAGVHVNAAKATRSWSLLSSKQRRRRRRRQRQQSTAIEQYASSPPRIGPPPSGRSAHSEPVQAGCHLNWLGGQSVRAHVISA